MNGNNGFLKLQSECVTNETRSSVFAVWNNVLVKVKEKNLISRDKFRDPKDYGPHQSVI